MGSPLAVRYFNGSRTGDDVRVTVIVIFTYDWDQGLSVPPSSIGCSSQGGSGPSEGTTSGAT